MTRFSRAPCRVAALPLLLAMAVGSCGSRPEPSTSPTASRADPIVTTSLEPSASTSTGIASVQPTASSLAGGTWGPLAVVAPQDGADSARTEGVLSVTSACVLLVANRGPILLVWPSDRTTWNSPSPTSMEAQSAWVTERRSFWEGAVTATRRLAPRVTPGSRGLTGTRDPIHRVRSRRGGGSAPSLAGTESL